MTDAYLHLTPFLMLGVVALLGFVGCAQIIGVEPWEGDGDGGNVDILLGPTNLVAVAGDSRVDLAWDAYANATLYHLRRGLVSGQYSITYDVDPSQATYPDTDVTNGTIYYYVVSAMLSSTETSNSDEAKATPMNPNEDFVTSFAVGTSANTFGGWAGMEFTVSTSSLSVFAVGRVHAPGDVQKHTIKIIEKSTLTDVASVLLDTTGGTDGEMQTVPLASPVTLNMNTTYYIVSEEFTGSDQVYMDDSTIQTTGAATVANAISGDGVTFLAGITGNHCFGPLTFQYMAIP